MQISELAQRSGVSVHALRHYEKLGLLTPARRASGYREYTEAMRREAVFIAMSRKVGFSLKAIALQLPAYRAGRLTIAQMVESLQTRVAEIDAQAQQLQTQRNEVVEHIAWLKKQERTQQVKNAKQLAAQESGNPIAPWPKVKSRKASNTTSTKKATP
ncbi:MAG TPA: MerR family DNA-binding transcriptional regulator [Polaromonas sp.]|uniref:MerR family DNA-binding transcriptional regulator n=1 Tax=Polaromonas sp. TaxID=1869339 RepID=UPI002D53439D|nr:MerR family DNA-binding transcriptional regulator [Polaromonas sp.]HYW55524.1 MerR family DNA-binding transcriptional regulator [Polaromonas sp.]